MADLISLSNASRSVARAWFRRRTLLQYAILVLGLATSFLWAIPPKAIDPALLPMFELISAIGAFILQILALASLIKGRHFHTLSRQGLQRSLLIDAFGETREPLDVAHLREKFGSNVLRLAESLPTSHYYTSSKPVGIERLRDNLQETAFFSTCLYRLTSWRIFLRMCVPTITILVLLFSLPLFGGGASFSVARALLAGIVFFSLSDNTAQLIACASASIEAGNVDRRLESIDLSRHEPTMATFADYFVATAAAPPIPETLYARNRDRLNSEWQQRRQ